MVGRLPQSRVCACAVLWYALTSRPNSEHGDPIIESGCELIFWFGCVPCRVNLCGPPLLYCGPHAWPTFWPIACRESAPCLVERGQWHGLHVGQLLLECGPIVYPERQPGCCSAFQPTAGSDCGRLPDLRAGHMPGPTVGRSLGLNAAQTF